VNQSTPVPQQRHRTAKISEGRRSSSSLGLASPGAELLRTRRRVDHNPLPCPAWADQDCCTLIAGDRLKRMVLLV
jgi:hypothetical protein